MIKTFHVAKRDFLATVLTKGFIIGVLVMPLIMTVAAPLALALVNRKPPAVAGEVAIIDNSTAAAATPELERTLSPEAIKAWITDQTESTKKAAAKVIAKSLPPDQAQQATSAVAAAADSVEVPELKITILPPNTDPATIKPRLLEKTEDGEQLLALITIDNDALTRDAAKDDFGTYAMSVRARLDIRVQGLLRSKVREAVIDARLKSNNEDPAAVRTLMRFDPPDVETWTAQGATSSGEMAQMFVPMGFMILLWISTFTGGQFLLTSTIEEKSNRIMEVLLSAVSPLELMVGKIIGQMCAGLMILVLYSFLGISAMIVFRQAHLVDWGNLVLMVALFLLCFGFIACMMAAIGSAVNDIHEAQSLMTPLMLIIVSPMILMMPIILDPKGVMATTMSFIPGVGPFVLMLRISSSDPPAAWQIATSLFVNAIYVVILAKLAAKIFRIGVLMYGKPPNFATLLRWIKMA
jgi:ABC-type Na+ efflux pump permease subunit